VDSNLAIAIGLSALIIGACVFLIIVSL